MVNLSAASRRFAQNHNKNNGHPTKLTTVQFPVNTKQVKFTDNLITNTKVRLNCERSDSGFSEANEEKICLDEGDHNSCSTISIDENLKKHKVQSQKTDLPSLNNNISKKIAMIPKGKTAFLRQKFENNNFS